MDATTRTIQRKAGRMTIKEAIETLEANYPDACYEQLRKAVNVAISALKQPEIIRCKDCKYHDEGYRRISVKWLPCMDIRPGSNWFCGSAERREE